MTALIDRMAKNDTAARKEALQTYATLLAKPQPEEGDDLELRRVMQVLNLDQVTVADDSQVVRSVLEQEQTIARLAAGEDARRERAVKATEALDVAHKALRAAEDEHRFAIGEHQGAATSAAYAKGEAGRLRREHPRAFGVEPAPVKRQQTTRFVGGLQESR